MEENQNIEWKESWRDEYLKWVCGFANAQGGSIFIGKNDKGKVVGLADSKKLMEDIPNKIRDILGIVADVNLHQKNGKEYIEITVAPNPYPVNYKGEHYYRTGSTKQVLRGQALSQFLLKKIGITWDSVPVAKASITDFRNDSFDIFREEAIKNHRMTKKDLEQSNQALLNSLDLLNEGNLTRAAILLFHHNPEKWISGSYIKIGYFITDAELKFQDEIHGSLVSQIDKVMEVIYVKYLKAEITYDGITRVETYPYPKEAIREAVLNAICHKDYSSLIPIQISVYDDKIYVANDGSLPEDWTVEDLMEKHKSKPFNPLIANTFFRMGMIESWGRGIEKMNNACVDARIPTPEYFIKPSDIMVLFKNTQENTQETRKKHARNLRDELGPVEIRIIDVIEANNNISQKQISIELKDLSYESVRHYVRKLQKAGILAREGATKKGQWRILL